MVAQREPEDREPRTPRPADAAPSAEVYSVANMITLLRLLMTPVVFTLLVVRNGRYATVAFVLFVVAAVTDFLDGQIARRTGTVTALGKVIDPLVDRLLIAFGVLGLYLLDRLPLWVVVVLVARDVWLLYGAWVLERHRKRVPVIFAGKVVTAALLTGFAGLMLGDAVSVAGITPMRAGTLLVYACVPASLLVAGVYTVRARRMVAEDGSGER